MSVSLQHFAGSTVLFRLTTRRCSCIYVYSCIPKWNPGLCLKLRVRELATAWAAVCSTAVVLLLLTFCLLLLPLREPVIVLCFVVRYFMFILVLQSS